MEDPPYHPPPSNRKPLGHLTKHPPHLSSFYPHVPRNYRSHRLRRPAPTDPPIQSCFVTQPDENPYINTVALDTLHLSHTTPPTIKLAQCLPAADSTFPSRARISLSTCPSRSPAAPLSLPRPPSPSSLLTHFFPTDPPRARATSPSRPSAASIALPARHLFQPAAPLPLHQSLSRRLHLLFRLTQSMRLPRRLLRR